MANPLVLESLSTPIEIRDITTAQFEVATEVEKRIRTLGGIAGIFETDTQRDTCNVTNFMGQSYSKCIRNRRPSTQISDPLWNTEIHYVFTSALHKCPTSATNRVSWATWFQFVVISFGRRMFGTLTRILWWYKLSSFSSYHRTYTLFFSYFLIGS
jgi:hypothetical protein